MDRKLVVLGINGHVGNAVARAFAAKGWQVTGFGRSNRYPIPGVNFIKGDAEDVGAMRAAIGDAEVVFNGLNLPYHEWDKGRKEAQTARVIEAMGTSGKTLLFPGNIYNYAPTLCHVTPDQPQVPPTPRGAIRQRVEAMYREAAERGDMQVIILRAGDFFGPGSTGDWIDLIMLREATKGKVATMGERGVGHSWAYLPDLAGAFEKLAWHRGELGRFDTFHFAGHFVTPEEMGAAIAAAAPVPVKVSAFPRFTIGLMGLVSPMMREIAKMGYLWEHPMQLEDRRLDAILGPGFGTPFADAVAATVTPYFAAARAAA